jgi:hypothetical protein
MVEFSMFVAGSISKSSPILHFQTTKTVKLIVILLAVSVHRQALSHGVLATAPFGLSLRSSESLEKCSGSCAANENNIFTLNLKTPCLNLWQNPAKLCMNLRGAGSEWTAFVDPASGSTYYYNSATQETSWTLPVAADPAGELTATEKLQGDGAAMTAGGGQPAAAVGAPQPQPTPAANFAPLTSSADTSTYPAAAAAASPTPGAAGAAPAQPSQQAPVAPGRDAGGAHRAEVRAMRSTTAARASKHSPPHAIQTAAR